MAGACLDLYEATGSIAYLDRARALVGDLDVARVGDQHAGAAHDK